jgi:hypothetical protein
VRSKFNTQLIGDVSMGEDGYAVPDGVSLVDWKVCSAILCNYSKLRGESEAKFDSDLYYLMHSFDVVAD